MTRQLNEHVKQIPAEVYLSELLKLRPLNIVESSNIITNFTIRAKEGLESPIKNGPGPYMLRSQISPPETSFSELIGKKAIAIDVGGTNLRLGLGEVGKDGRIKPIGNIKTKEIPIKYSSLDDFFEMLLKNGLDKLLRENPDIPLACIFSFPGEGLKNQDGIDIVLGHELTKEWEISGSAGAQLGTKLNQFLVKKDQGSKAKKNSFEKRQYFIANDTVALIRDQETDAGIVCASGYNWAIVVDNKILQESRDLPGRTIVNSESGSADTVPGVPVITERLLESIVGEQNKQVDQVPLRDEYQVSGKYLGRTLGLIVDDLKTKYGLFKNVKNTVFPKSFVVSNILSASENDNWKKVEHNFSIPFYQHLSGQEKDLLTQIASALRYRSAQIVADHLFALWKTCCPEKHLLNVSSDGPIIQNMPGWKDKFFDEIESVSKGQLEVKIHETSYQRNLRNYRGIFDVMYQAIEHFARENK